MKWWLLGVASVFVLGVALELRRRVREKWTGPHYVRQVQDWYAADAYLDEPPLKRLDLPPVRQLKAQRVDKVARFRQRVGARS